MAPNHDLRVRNRIYRAQLGAYLLIIIVGVVGFWKMGQNQDDIIATQEQQQADRCLSGFEVRAAQRANINAVYALAVTLVEPQKGEPEPTPEQQAGIDRYLATAKDFRDKALAKVPPTPPGCEEYQGGGE